MIPYFLYLQYLTFINLNTNHLPDFEAKHALAMKSGSILPFCNRVCAQSDVTKTEVIDVKDYFNDIAFRWFVQDSDTAQIQVLEEAHLKYVCSFPAMAMDLSELKPVQNKPGITIEEVTNESGMATWFSIVSKSYGMTNQPEFEKFIYELKRRSGPNGIRFYIGSHEGIAAAVSVTVMHGDAIGLHWVGTLPEHRNKGLGFAVSVYPLLEAQARGCTTAILFASELGKPVYEHIGFKEYAIYKVFGP